MRRTLVILALVATLSGCVAGSGQPSAPIEATVTATATAKALLVMPDVVGENAAVAVDKLKKLGFTNIDLGTVDGRPLVVLPQNWTVKTQSAKPGQHLAADTKIVLGCARNA